jgi:hypothetical protein
VAVGAEGVGLDRAAGQALGAGVERIPLGTLRGVGDLLSLVEQNDGRAPVGLVGQGIEREGGLVVRQCGRKFVHLHRRRAQRDVVLDTLRVKRHDRRYHEQ